ncbi:MAG TPA: hypothetical protein VGG10_11040 [Rhizomicrobium sp.]|jgi:hypothetical protein
MRRVFIMAALALCLGGCVEPIAVVGANGFLLRGTTSASPTNAGFTVTNGKLTCTGSYDPWNVAEPTTMTVACSDGRKGVVIARRDSGTGHLRLNDGTEADVVVGSAAKVF